MRLSPPTTTLFQALGAMANENYAHSKANLYIYPPRCSVSIASIATLLFPKWKPCASDTILSSGALVALLSRTKYRHEAFRSRSTLLNAEFWQFLKICAPTTNPFVSSCSKHDNGEAPLLCKSIWHGFK